MLLLLSAPSAWQTAIIVSIAMILGCAQCEKTGLTQGQGQGHGLVAFGGDAVQATFADLADQAMTAKQAQTSADPRNVASAMSAAKLHTLPPV